MMAPKYHEQCASTKQEWSQSCSKKTCLHPKNKFLTDPRTGPPSAALLGSAGYINAWLRHVSTPGRDKRAPQLPAASDRKPTVHECAACWSFR
eukprot:s7302_g5.t1